MSVIANNRFLQRTNPVMRAAITDGGSVLANEYIQRSARQMVNKDIYQYLVDWLDRDLVKTRTSGSDLYIPKAYDISPNENDAVQTDTTKQPLLDTLGMKFDGSDDRLLVEGSTSIAALEELTLMGWIYLRPVVSTAVLGYLRTTGGHIGILKITVSSVDVIQINGRNSAGQGVFSDNVPYTANTWNHFALTRKSGEDHRFYFNNAVVPNNSANEDQTINTLINRLSIGCRITEASEDLFSNDTQTDIRLFNTALSATDISDIYNLTKSRYGL